MTKDTLSEYVIDTALKDGFDLRIKKLKDKISQNLKEQAAKPNSMLLKAELSRLENQKTITETALTRLKI